METVTDFILLGSKITVDGDYSWKIKRWLLLGRKAMTNLESILKTETSLCWKKICIIKAMIFSVLMLEKGLAPTPVFLGFPGVSTSRESSCKEGDLSLIPGFGRCPEEGRGYPLQYSGLEDSMDIIVHAVAKSQTQLSDFHFHSNCFHVWMWELDHKEGWAPMNWCFWTVILEKTLESPLDFKEIKPVNPKGNQPWIFIWRTDAEAPVLWPPVLEKTLMLERLKVGREGCNRGWNGWMVSLNEWT